MRSRASRFRAHAKGSRSKVWVNIPFGAMAFTEAVGNQVLLVGEDWESQFTGLAWERATLLTIKGEIQFAQTVVGTHGSTLFWGLYIDETDSTVVPSFTTANMSEVDWLHVGCFGIAATLVTQTQASLQHVAINVKTKRKITSRDSVYLCAQVSNDAASPAGVAGGIVRFLVARA